MIYIVQQGDTLYDIAKIFNTEIDKVAKLNMISKLTIVFPGQVLLIPIPEQSSANGKYYISQPGDTLYMVCHRYNIPLDWLICINRFTPPYTIFPGQRIFIPINNTVNTSKEECIYTIEPEDTIHSISAKFNTTIISIIEKNNILRPDLIHSGEKIVIPTRQ